MTRNVLRKLTVEDIRHAVRYGALERRRESLQGRLDSVLKEMAALEGSGRASAPVRRRGPGRPPKAENAPRKWKPFSAATRRKMALAQRARWDKVKARKAIGAKPEEAKPERKTRRKWRMSAEGRQRIADAARRRWAAVKAAKEAPKADAKAGVQA